MTSPAQAFNQCNCQATVVASGRLVSKGLVYAVDVTSTPPPPHPVGVAMREGFLTGVEKLWNDTHELLSLKWRHTKVKDEEKGVSQYCYLDQMAKRRKCQERKEEVSRLRKREGGARHMCISAYIRNFSEVRRTVFAHNQADERLPSEEAFTSASG